MNDIAAAIVEEFTGNLAARLRQATEGGGVKSTEMINFFPPETLRLLTLLRRVIKAHIVRLFARSKN